MDLDLCFFTVLFAMPVAVWLSQCIGVGGCGWPSSSRMSQMIFPAFAFRKSAANSASAAEHTANFSMPHMTKIFLLVMIGRPLLGILPKK